MSYVHPNSAADVFHFHVNLADSWERQYLARRLGISEEALVASSSHVDPTVEEIFDRFCPDPLPPGLHTQVHLAHTQDADVALHD